MTEQRLYPSLIRSHARSDIEWGTLTKLMLIYMGIITGITILSVIPAALIPGAVGTTISSLISMVSFVLAVIMMPGLMQSFLDVRRCDPVVTGLFGAKDRALPYLGFTMLLVLMAMGIIMIPMILTAVSPVIGAIVSIAAVVFLVFIALMYAMAPYFCVEGAGAVESLKASRTAMKGSKWRLFVSLLPIVGWSILASLVSSLAMYLPVGVAIARNGFSLVGAVIALINFIILSIAVMIPVAIYENMITAEFYDDLTGHEMNPEIVTSKKPILVMGIMTLVLTLISSILVALPVSWTPLDDVRSKLENKTDIVQELEPGITENAVNDIAEDKTLPEENDQNDSAVPEDKISFTAPAGYELTTYTDSSRFYSKGEDWISLTKFEATSNDISYLKEAQDASEIKVADSIGYFYTIDNYAYCEFVKGGYHYNISSTNQADLQEAISSIR